MGLHICIDELELEHEFVPSNGGIELAQYALNIPDESFSILFLSAHGHGAAHCLPSEDQVSDT